MREEKERKERKIALKKEKLAWENVYARGKAEKQNGEEVWRIREGGKEARKRIMWERKRRKKHTV